MLDDLLLGLEEGQAGNMDFSVESQADGTVRSDKALAGDGPAGESFKDLDYDEVGGLDRVGRPILEGRCRLGLDGGVCSGRA